MLKTALLAMTACLGLALPAESQVHVHGKLGRNVTVSASIGHNHNHYYRGHRVAPRRGVVRTGGGYFRTVRHRVWVPGYYEKVYHPAEYGWVYDRCGRRRWAVVQAAHYDDVWRPGRWEYRSQRRWVSQRPYRRYR